MLMDYYFIHNVKLMIKETIFISLLEEVNSFLNLFK